MSLHLFDAIHPARLRRIAEFLRFNPSIPSTEFSQIHQKLFSLTVERQEQWLVSHREELLQEFESAGSRTSKTLLKQRRSYSDIVRSLAGFLTAPAQGQSLFLVEVEVLRKTWNLMHGSIETSQRQKLDAYVSETFDGGVAADFAELIHFGETTKQQRLVRILAIVILSQIRKGLFDLDAALQALPCPEKPGLDWLLLSPVFLGAAFVDGLDRPNYVKCLPVVLEVLTERIERMSLSSEYDSKHLEVSSSAKQVGDSIGNVTSANHDEVWRLHDKTPSAQPGEDARIGRLEEAERFRISVRSLEKSLRHQVSYNQWNTRTNMTLGETISELETARAYAPCKIDELRKINRVRRDLFHDNGREILDGELEIVNHLLDQWNKTFAKKHN